jgi:hypothetical protein
VSPTLDVSKGDKNMDLQTDNTMISRSEHYRDMSLAFAFIGILYVIAVPEWDLNLSTLFSIGVWGFVFHYGWKAKTACGNPKKEEK